MWAKIIRNNLKSNLRLNLNLRYILYIPSTITIIYLSILFQLANNASALTYQNDTNIDFTINPTIGISLSSTNLVIDDLAPGSYADSNIITISVNSNASHGYYLSATAGDNNTTSANHNTNLTNTINNNYTFASLTTSQSSLSDFGDNNWGYSYCLTTNDCTTNSNWISGSSGSTTAGYNGLPLDSGDNGATGVTLINTTSPVANGSVQFKIGAKASNTQASGTYTNTINFYAITNQTPISFNDAFATEGKERLLGYYKMQDATPSICNAVTENQVGTLIDVRDNQTYKVAKLKDGKCWMVENLNLAGGTKLSSDTTDFEPTYSLPTDQGWKSDGSLPDSSKSGFDNDNYAYVYNSGNKTNNCANPGCYTYYSWDAATLGSGRNLAEDNTDAPYSICPKGWKLPTSRTTSATDWQTTSDFYQLAHQYGLDSTTSPNESDNGFYTQAGPGTTPNFLLAGYYIDSSFSGGDSYGLYWSATSRFGSTHAYDLNFYSSYVYSAGIDFRRYGFAVRCILKAAQ